MPAPMPGQERDLLAGERPQHDTGPTGCPTASRSACSSCASKPGIEYNPLPPITPIFGFIKRGSFLLMDFPQKLDGLSNTDRAAGLRLPRRQAQSLQLGVYMGHRSTKSRTPSRSIVPEGTRASSRIRRRDQASARSRRRGWRLERNAQRPRSTPRFPRPSCATVSGSRPASSRRAGLPDSDSCGSRVPAWSAPGRSALLMTNTSAISIMPALIACTSSPSPGTSTTTVTSASRAISTSSCPTPTVSTSQRRGPPHRAAAPYRRQRGPVHPSSRGWPSSG